MDTPLRILVIEDNPADFMLLERGLLQTDINANCHRVCSNDELDAALENEWDIVLADYNVPGMKFDESLQHIKARRPELPVILVSGGIGEEAAIALLHSGITDFVFKDHLNRLPDAIRRALKEAGERRARSIAEAALRASQTAAFENQRAARLAALNLMEDAVAARQRAEAVNAALRESEKRFSDIVEASADWIWEVNAEGVYTFASDSVFDVLGYTSAEVLGKTPFDFMPPDEAKIVKKEFQELVSKCMPFRDLDNVNLHKDGSLRYVQTNGMPILGEHGELLGYRGLDRDITARKQAEAERDLFNNALRQAAHPLLLFDTNDLITYVNPAFTRLFGYKLEDLVGEHVSRILPKTEKYESEQNDILRQLRESGLWSGEVDRLAIDGTLIPTAANISSIRGKHNELLGFVASYLDLRPLREKEASLRKLSLAVEQSPESIVITDLNGNIEYVNEAFVRNTGYSREESFGQNPRILQSGHTPKTTYETFWGNLTSGEVWQGELYNKRKDGSEYIENAIVSPIRQPDGRITHYVAIKEDITEKKRNEAEIHRLAFYDSLTTLPNRALLLERITQTLALTRRVGHRSALISFNIDRFKTVNDAGGQMLGDSLLKAVGEKLSDTLREGDIVARISGDEFAILLTDLASQKNAAAHLALKISEKIHTSLQEPFHVGNEHLSLSACLGIALFPENNDDLPLDILRRSNTALHHAKTRGRGQTAFFENTLDEMAKQRFVIERELHKAIAAGELRLFLQPQVDAAGKIVGAEALVRWQHPQRGLIQPAAFIPIAEESNLIIEIGTWVFNEVCHLLAREDVFELPIRIAVNISPRHFRQAGFVDQIKNGLASSGADPTHLTLEVTEGMLIDNLKDVIAKMAELSIMGIHFSMDDFGTGYSSLSYLKRLPIHELKIDKSFIQELTMDPESDALVETILAVAKLMHLKVVAEGVETAEQAAFLNQRGPVTHQGYLFGRPQLAETFIAEINKKGI